MNRLLAMAILVVPLGLDRYVPVPESNPLTAEQIELGRRLFFDRRLSGDGSVACVSCHHPDRAFADGRQVPIGAYGRIGRRNTPALVNRAYGRAFSWDGRAGSLEQQVLGPIGDPLEMASTPEEAAARVGLTPDELSRALASYVRSILSGNAPFDRFVEGDTAALSVDAGAGLELFRGKGHCNRCHLGPTLTDEAFHNTGVAWQNSRSADEGRWAVTRRAEDRRAFKTPTLREVVRTAPYMHDGSLASLEDVVAYYDRGGHADPQLDSEIAPLHLTSTEQRQLVAFLEALTGTVQDGVGISR